MIVQRVVYANRRWGRGRLLQLATRLYCRLRGHRLGRWWEGTRRCERGCGGVALMETCAEWKRREQIVVKHIADHGRLLGVELVTDVHDRGCLHPPHPGRPCGWCIEGTVDVSCRCGATL